VATPTSATRCSPSPALPMPRLTQFQRWFFRTVAYRAVLTLVALALLAPRPLLAVTPGGGITPSSGHVGSSNRAPKRSTPAHPRFSYVTITRNGSGTVSVYTYASGSVTFTVRNDGAPLTALFSASICTGNITNCSEPERDISLDRRLDDRNGLVHRRHHGRVWAVQTDGSGCE
jgi:hypothetical protein